jgi:hypothetical protein
MSLSWRKRQAKASDQQTWRGLGVDSALWTSIDRNASNVTASLVKSTETPTQNTGIVTGLKFVKTEGLAFTAAAPLPTIYASDPSNVNVASKSGVNLFDTAHPSANSGTGLTFTLKKYDAGSTFLTNEINTDISGIKYYINSGGSGYNVGDDIMLQGTNRMGVKFTFPSVNLANDTNIYEPVVQDPYRITDISVNLTAGAAIAKGQVVQLFDGDLADGGYLTGNQTVASNLYNFNLPATPGTLTGDAFTTFDFTAQTPGTLTGGTFTGADFGTIGSQNLVVVIQSTPITCNMNTDCSTSTLAAAKISSELGANGSCAVVNGVLVITSSTPGASSSVDITAALSGTEALALFGGAGAWTTQNGAANSHQDLKFSINGAAEQTITLNFTQPANVGAAATAVDALTPANVGCSDNGSVLILTTTGTGAGSTVTMNSSGSGANAVALFGNPANFVLGTGADATAEDLKVKVDNLTEQTLTISANVTNNASAIGANGVTGITGATVSIDNNKIKIKSNTTGTNSKVSINTVGSGANALALFGTAPFTTVIGNEDANIIATGFLTNPVPAGVGNQEIKIHSSTANTGNFLNSAGKTMKINPTNPDNISSNGADFGTVNTGTGGSGFLTGSSPEKIGFANENKTAANGIAVEFGQWVTRPADQTFRSGNDSAFSPLKSSTSGQTLISAHQMGTTTITPAAYGTLKLNVGPTVASAIINGRLAARVTSIANTSPNAGRN